MSATTRDCPRAQSRREEVANSLCHGAGLAGATVGTPFLIVGAARAGDAAYVVGAGIFCAAMILLYSASTAYHALPPGRAKRLFLALDHSAILVLIAGTYTPFTLGVLRDTSGWPLFAAVWALAGVGLVLRAFGRATHPVAVTALYLAMGWLVLFDLDGLVAAVPQAGLGWLLAGGLCYTLGIAFFAIGARVRYCHAVWHACVVAGTACHYFAVMWYGV